MKRYELGNKLYGGLSVPEIVEREDGEYVRYGDMVAAVNEALEEAAEIADSMNAFGVCDAIRALKMRES